MRNIFSVALVAVALSGCGTIAKTYYPDDVIGINDEAIKINDSISIKIEKNGVIDLSSINYSQFDGLDNFGVRNSFIASVIYFSDEKCHVHKAKIISNSATFNVSFGSAALLFSGAAAVVTPATAAAQLAAGATLLSGVQTLTNKEVYSEAMGTTILRAIDVSREKTRATLKSGMADKSYPFAQAIVDLRAYHDSCSLMAGLVEINKLLGNRKLSKNEILTEVDALKDISSKTTSINGLTPEQKNAINQVYIDEIKNKMQSLKAD